MELNNATLGTQLASWRLNSSSAPHRVRSALLGVIGLTLFLAATSSRLHAAEMLTICYGSTSAALIPLAKLRNFYASEGVDVEISSFPSGRQALETMLSGKCEMAAVAEAPVAHYSLSRNDFLILAAISVSSNFERMIVRSDRGIRVAADLRGRRIAVTQFTSAHYFLDLYLAANGLALQDVIKVYLPATEVAAAFLRGDVDAAVQWEPTIQMLVDALGTKAKVITVPGLHVSPFLLVGVRDYVRKNPVIIDKVLRALLHAERLAKEQPTQAKALMASSYKIAKSEVDLIWPLYDFRVSLDQSLLFILENAARWDIALLPPAQRPSLPNYLDLIYLDGLLAVKPAAVTIIH